MKTNRFACALICLVAGVATAQGMKMPMPAKPVASAAPRPALPAVQGEVRKVDVSKGTVLLKHGDVPNLGMSAMTMAYDVADRKMLDGLKAGDKVLFQADMVGGKATIVNLRPARN